MWPWGHAAVGYLLYRAGLRDRGGDPTGPATIALGIGTQFPDLIDKPLGWTFGLLPSGRSLAHSLLTAALVIAVVYALARRYGDGAPAAAGAFGVGYVSHSLADLPPGLLVGAAPLETAGFLVWPVVPAYVYAGEESFAAHLPPEPTPYLAVQFGLFAVATALWLRDGAPGLGTLARAVGRPTGPR